MACQLCDGQQALLGVLGNRVHLRCIQCGMDSSHKATPEELAEIDAAQNGTDSDDDED